MGKVECRDEWALGYGGPDATVEHRLNAVAEAAHDSPALLAGSGVLVTHADLRRRRDGWRAALRTAGIAKNDRVAVVMTSGWRMAEVLIGTLCATVAAPLDPALTDRELNAYLTQLAPTAVVTDTSMLARLRMLVGEGIPVLPADLPRKDSPADGDAAAPDDLALLLFTSGTTARPKIVELTQRNLVAAADTIGTSMALSDTDRALNLMPLHHGHGITAGTLAPLLSGGSTVCGRVLDADQLAALARTTNPTWYSAAPVIHNSVLATLRTKPELASSLRLRAIRSTSSPLPARWLSELEDTFGAPVVEAYALSEAPGHAATNPLRGQRKTGTVGKPGLTRVALLTSEGITAQLGVIGEILVRGPNVMRGYADVAQADQPFLHGWLRTGDEGSFDTEGYLTISGRVSEIISRGAEKISPAEVESALLEHDAVLEAAVFGQAHPTLGQETAAAVMLAEGAVATEDSLIAFVADRLASFKVPVRVDIVSDLPRSATGKLKRQQLRELSNRP